MQSGESVNIEDFKDQVFSQVVFFIAKYANHKLEFKKSNKCTPDYLPKIENRDYESIIKYYQGGQGEADYYIEQYLNQHVLNSKENITRFHKILMAKLSQDSDDLADSDHEQDAAIDLASVASNVQQFLESYRGTERTAPTERTSATNATRATQRTAGSRATQRTNVTQQTNATRKTSSLFPSPAYDTQSQASQRTQATQKTSASRVTNASRATNATQHTNDTHRTSATQHTNATRATADTNFASELRNDQSEESSSRSSASYSSDLSDDERPDHSLVSRI